MEKLHANCWIIYGFVYCIDHNDDGSYTSFCHDANHSVDEEPTWEEIKTGNYSMVMGSIMDDLEENEDHSCLNDIIKSFIEK